MVSGKTESQMEWCAAGIAMAECKTAYQDPPRFLACPDIFKALILESRAHAASDVYIQADSPVCAMINGRMLALTNRPLDTDEVKNILEWVAGRPTALTDILTQRAVNARYIINDPDKRAPNGAHIQYAYRVNAVPVYGAGGVSAQIVMRTIPSDPPDWQTVGLSPEILRAATPENGIVYIGGSTGSGKTTTFAAIIRHILETPKAEAVIHGNLITIEEPIEFTYRNIRSEHSILKQSQVPEHFASFKDGVREAMRRSPRLVLIGELRDAETISAARELALTGHPVYATVHVTNVAGALPRLVSRFDQAERATMVFDLIDTVRLIMVQKLVRGVDDKLLAAREHLVFDQKIRDELIALGDIGRVTERIRQLVREHSNGHSFATEGKRLLEEGKIDASVAEKLLHS
ncbi:MAG: Flp pilus assembly complex ATPase component TadA [Azoarcus sp.]|jgi:defect-in-organelle-trafficking protein DotB|nr:Flp pilus assembly complex ATPase component TadA [Azoarcus sp.]